MWELETLARHGLGFVKARYENNNLILTWSNQLHTPHVLKNLQHYQP